MKIIYLQKKKDNTTFNIFQSYTFSGLDPILFQSHSPRGMQYV